MNRSRTAQDLLAQICIEKDNDVVIVSEQYRDSTEAGWYRDVLGTAAIWILDTQRHMVSHQGSGRGYVWVRCSQINFISCYVTPNESIGDFQAKLDCLEDAAIDMEGELIVAGDFNAKALEYFRQECPDRSRNDGQDCRCPISPLIQNGLRIHGHRMTWRLHHSHWWNSEELCAH